MKRTEADITKSIRAFLKTFNIFHWKVWQGLGSEKGVSDIVGIYKGKFFAIEVKRSDALKCPFNCRHKTCAAQKRFLNGVNSHGGIGFVARSIDDVVNNLKIDIKWNV